MLLRRCLLQLLPSLLLLLLLLLLLPYTPGQLRHDT
jgi:hypothetical protein